jgi:hypothetical protein
VLGRDVVHPEASRLRRGGLEGPLGGPGEGELCGLDVLLLLLGLEELEKGEREREERRERERGRRGGFDADDALFFFSKTLD